MYKSTLFLALAQLAFTSPIVPRQDPCNAQGPGVCLQNQMGADHEFFFYRNEADGNGWAIPTYEPDRPPVRVPNGGAVWVGLDPEWRGRIQRANTYPSTWVEFQVRSLQDSRAWGDISYIQGFDGPATIASMDGSVRCGWEGNLVDGAPEAAIYTRGDGRRVLANTEFNPILFVEGNVASRDWMESQIGTAAPMPGYTRNDSPACVANDASNQLRVTWLPPA